MSGYVRELLNRDNVPACRALAESASAVFGDRHGVFQPLMPGEEEMPEERRRQRAVFARPEGFQKVSTYILVVGIDKYRFLYPELASAEEDAISFQGTFRDPYNQARHKSWGNLDVNFEITSLFGSEATSEAIVQWLTDVQKVIQERDSVIVYWAGHGRTVVEASTGFQAQALVPYDSGPGIECCDVLLCDLVAWAAKLPAVAHFVIDAGWSYNVGNRGLDPCVVPVLCTHVSSKLGGVLSELVPASVDIGTAVDTSQFMANAQFYIAERSASACENVFTPLFLHLLSRIHFTASWSPSAAMFCGLLQELMQSTQQVYQSGPYFPGHLGQMEPLSHLFVCTRTSDPAISQDRLAVEEYNAQDHSVPAEITTMRRHGFLVRVRVTVQFMKRVEPHPDGLEVITVPPRSDEYRAGLRQGQVITSIGPDVGKPATLHDLQELEKLPHDGYALLRVRTGSSEVSVRRGIPQIVCVSEPVHFAGVPHVVELFTTARLTGAPSITVRCTAKDCKDPCVATMPECKFNVGQASCQIAVLWGKAEHPCFRAATFEAEMVVKPDGRDAGAATIAVTVDRDAQRGLKRALATSDTPSFSSMHTVGDGVKQTVVGYDEFALSRGWHRARMTIPHEPITVYTHERVCLVSQTDTLEVASQQLKLNGLQRHRLATQGLVFFKPEFPEKLEDKSASGRRWYAYSIPGCKVHLHSDALEPILDPMEHGTRFQKQLVHRLFASRHNSFAGDGVHAVFFEGDVADSESDHVHMQRAMRCQVGDRAAEGAMGAAGEGRAAKVATGGCTAFRHHHSTRRTFLAVLGWIGESFSVGVPSSIVLHVSCKSLQWGAGGRESQFLLLHGAKCVKEEGVLVVHEAVSINHVVELAKSLPPCVTVVLVVDGSRTRGKFRLEDVVQAEPAEMPTADQARLVLLNACRPGCEAYEQAGGGHLSALLYSRFGPSWLPAVVDAPDRIGRRLSLVAACVAHSSYHPQRLMQYPQIVCSRPLPLNSCGSDREFAIFEDPETRFIHVSGGAAQGLRLGDRLTLTASRSVRAQVTALGLLRSTVRLFRTKGRGGHDLTSAADLFGSSAVLERCLPDSDGPIPIAELCNRYLPQRLQTSGLCKPRGGAAGLRGRLQTVYDKLCSPPCTDLMLGRLIGHFTVRLPDETRVVATMHPRTADLVVEVESLPSQSTSLQLVLTPQTPCLERCAGAGVEHFITVVAFFSDGSIRVLAEATGASATKGIRVELNASAVLRTALHTVSGRPVTILRIYVTQEPMYGMDEPSPLFGTDVDHSAGKGAAAIPPAAVESAAGGEVDGVPLGAWAEFDMLLADWRA